MYISEMSQLQRYDAGTSGETFYQVTLQPGDWYKWFEKSSVGSDSKPDGKEDDSGWTEVHIHYVHLQLIL